MYCLHRIISSNEDSFGNFTTPSQAAEDSKQRKEALSHHYQPKEPDLEEVSNSGDHTYGIESDPFTQLAVLLSVLVSLMDQPMQPFLPDSSLY